jgi:NitT/TauT family transport system permease protein
METHPRKRIALNPNPLFFLAGILLFIGLWEIIAFGTGQTFFPEFFGCIANMFTLLGQAKTAVALGWTFLRCLASLALSGVLGIVLGVLNGYYGFLGKILAPVISILRSVPTIAVLLLLVVYVPNFWLFVTSLVLFPVIYQASYEGASKNYQQYENELLLKGKNHLSNITMVIFPLSLNYILLGLVQALGMSIKVEIMSETFAYSSTFQGIGKEIYLCYTVVDYEKMMAYVLMTVILSLVLDGILITIKGRVESKLGLTKEERRRLSIWSIFTK